MADQIIDWSNIFTNTEYEFIEVSEIIDYFLQRYIECSGFYMKNDVLLHRKYFFDANIMTGDKFIGVSLSPRFFELNDTANITLKDLLPNHINMHLEILSHIYRQNDSMHYRGVSGSSYNIAFPITNKIMDIYIEYLKYFEPDVDLFNTNCL